MNPYYYGEMDPKFPCRILESRHCPAVYDSTCGDRPCARFESEDSDPWLPEIFEPRKALLFPVGRKI